MECFSDSCCAVCSEWAAASLPNELAGSTNDGANFLNASLLSPSSTGHSAVVFDVAERCWLPTLIVLLFYCSHTHKVNKD